MVAALGQVAGASALSLQNLGQARGGGAASLPSVSSGSGGIASVLSANAGGGGGGISSILGGGGGVSQTAASIFGASTNPLSSLGAVNESAFQLSVLQSVENLENSSFLGDLLELDKITSDIEAEENASGGQNSNGQIIDQNA